ncbi:hypothetical protein FHS90_002667 [Rufibacter quisquiliarum]|uniref:Uncharacterized protein n=1 Tax=Rufibacter quisquiliarum TaxID=1549639 RepID=A0A839GEA8_9BACT|nr:hypothetical protein [Rufibacter quisquiliarum]
MFTWTFKINAKAAPFGKILPLSKNLILAD